MIYGKHNFKNNYVSASAINDIAITTDILTDSLSDLLLNKTETIIGLLNRCAIPTGKDPALEEIVDKVLNNISINSMLVRGIAFLIAEQEGLIEESKNKAEAFDLVNKIAIGVRRIANKIKSSEQEYFSVKENMMNLLKIKSKAITKEKQKTIRTNKKFWKITIILTVTLLGAIALISNWDKIFGKKTLKTEKKDEGGSIEDTGIREGQDDNDPLRQKIEDVDYGTQGHEDAGGGAIPKPAAQTQSSVATGHMQRLYDKSRINPYHKQPNEPRGR